MTEVVGENDCTGQEGHADQVGDPQGTPGDRVFVWHGELDQNVPAYFGHFVGQAIPRCRAVFYPDEAHLSIIVNRADEIVSALIAEPA